MRAALVLPILLLAACQVSKDPNNNSMTLEYNSNAVTNGTRAVTTEAGKLAGDIADDVKDTGNKIQSKIGEQTADHNTADNAVSNTTTNKH